MFGVFFVFFYLIPNLRQWRAGPYTPTSPSLFSCTKVLGYNSCCTTDWFILVDLCNAYFHITTYVLMFDFHRQTFQFKVLPFELCLVAQIFLSCMLGSSGSEEWVLTMDLGGWGALWSHMFTEGVWPPGVRLEHINKQELRVVPAIKFFLLVLRLLVHSEKSQSDITHQGRMTLCTLYRI